MTEETTYHGSCHCGAVRFSAVTALDKLMDCNCSRCHRLGWIMQPVPAAKFTLLSGADKLRDYRFNTEKIRHRFCVDCGIEPFATGSDQDGNDVYMVNVNCLEDAPDIDRATIFHWDGRSR